MIDFNQKLHDTDKFRQAAIFFQQHGCYTLAPRGTTDYNKYWEQETDRCINGYTAPDGEGITGYNYFYLNYSPIMRLKEEEYTDREGNLRKRRQRILEFPSFWDYDYYYFCAIEQAELEGKHMAVLKCRQRGYSFKGGSMLVRNYMLVPGSKNFAIASEQKFLIGDGLLTKAWQIMDFLDKHTAWAKQRLVSTRMERTSGYKITDEFGKQTEQGYLSSITGITLKNDPERVRGTRAKLVLWEEGGKFPSLLDAWRIEQPSVETDDGKAFGLMIAFGTGGTEGASFEGLKELFYKPKSYNVLSFPNIWDEGRENTECAFFVPAYSNLESFDDDGNQVYMDKDGNSYKEKAIQNLIDQRNKVKDGGASQQSIDRFISERPIKPAEAVLELGKNIFPRKLLMDQLTRIRTNKKLQSMKHVVDLEWDGNGQVKATEKPSGDITNYPLKKGDKPHGSVVIWEYPVKDPPHGLYIGGCLTPGEKVCTQRGLLNVEDVTLDDKLINKFGNFVEINNLQRYYKENEDVFRVKMANSFRTTQFTSEHPIYVCDKYYQQCKFVKAKDIKVGQYTRIPNLYWYTNENVCTPIKHIDFWWFVGLWLGDGWVDNKKHSVSIAFDLKQPSFYNQYYKFLKENNIVPYSRKRNGSLEVKFTNKDICVWLTQTFGKYCYGKYIPDNVKRISSNDKLKLLQGYLDSDGCVCVNKKTNSNSIEFVSVNLQLLEDIQDICFGLNVVGGISRLRKAKKSIIQGRVVNQRETYHLRIAHNNSCNLAIPMICNSSFNDEKLQKINIHADVKLNTSKDCICVGPYIYVKIKAIEQSRYTGIVYNFECDTHTFMCRSIMTHNCDPYDHDDSFTNSLGSTFIFKRVRAGEAWTDVIVAEYSGRPDTAEEYYENVRKLLTFYNARLLFENERKGIYPYFTNKHCDYLLADQPDKIISEVFKDSKVQRRKGCHMTKQIRAYGEGLILEWLLDEFEEGHPNVERVYSEPLIEELIENDGIRNVDRVIALCMVMIYREELYQVKVSSAKEQNKQVELFEMPLFSKQWFEEDSSTSEDGMPIFTF